MAKIRWKALSEMKFTLYLHIKFNMQFVQALPDPFATILHIEGKEISKESLISAQISETKRISDTSPPLKRSVQLRSLKRPRERQSNSRHPSKLVYQRTPRRVSGLKKQRLGSASGYGTSGRSRFTKCDTSTNYETGANNAFHNLLWTVLALDDNQMMELSAVRGLVEKARGGIKAGHLKARRVDVLNECVPFATLLSSHTPSSTMHSYPSLQHRDLNVMMAAAANPQLNAEHTIELLRLFKELGGDHLHKNSRGETVFTFATRRGTVPAGAFASGTRNRDIVPYALVEWLLLEGQDEGSVSLEDHDTWRVANYTQRRHLQMQIHKVLRMVAQAQTVRAQRGIEAFLGGLRCDQSAVGTALAQSTMYDRNVLSQIKQYIY